jgi:hypothetical protein
VRARAVAEPWGMALPSVSEARTVWLPRSCASASAQVATLWSMNVSVTGGSCRALPAANQQLKSYQGASVGHPQSERNAVCTRRSHPASAGAVSKRGHPAPPDGRRTLTQPRDEPAGHRVEPVRVEVPSQLQMSVSSGAATSVGGCATHSAAATNDRALAATDRAHRRGELHDQTMAYHASPVRANAYADPHRARLDRVTPPRPRAQRWRAGGHGCRAGTTFR